MKKLLPLSDRGMRLPEGVLRAIFVSFAALSGATACERAPSGSSDPFHAEDNSAPWQAPRAAAEPQDAPSTDDAAPTGPAPLAQQPGTLPTPTAADAPLTGSGGVVPRPGAPASFADLVDRVQPAVVNIYTEQVVTSRQMMIDPVYGPYAVERPRAVSSLGSGFIVDSEGYVLTNTHVISGARSIRISTSDGREFPASVVGTDPQTDIALLRVEPFEGMVVLEMGDSTGVRVGDWLMAVGNPFGLQSTVTVGILSARGRRNVPLQGQIRYMDFLQTDASINPGNSGGPLIDMQGRVVGINTAINAEGQGIGFAIPIDMARPIFEQLRATGAVSRSWLGVQLVSDPSQPVVGAMIGSVVHAGPSENAGIQRGDVIVSFDGQEVRSSDELPWLASNAGVGQSVVVGIVRDGQRYDVNVVMGALPN